jgi:hypothetical protein
MPVRIVENWSDLVAQVKDIHPAEELDGFDLVELFVEEACEVEGFPNLLAESVETSIGVFFPDECVKSHEISPGSLVSCRVRRANLTKNFVHREFISILN